VAALVPLAFDPGGHFAFLPLKWTTAAAGVAAGLALLLLQGAPVARPRLLWAWAGLLAALAVSSVLGVGGVTSWIGYPGRSLGVVTWLVFAGAFLLGASIADPRARERVVLATSAASILVSGYALLQEAGVDPVEWSEGLDVSRTRSTVGNAAFLGAYLAMVVPLAGRLALAPASRRVRVVHAAAAVLGLWALLTTETRGAWLGTLAGGVLVVALEYRRLRAVLRRSLLALGAALVAVLLLVTVSPFAARARSIADPGSLTGRGRLTQWERTLDLVADRPVLGWGPETYAFTFPRFIDAEFERTVGRAVVPDRAHNVVLDMAASAGLVGLAAYVSLLALLARAVAQARERSAATVGLAGAGAAYLGQLQFSFPVADLDTVFWLLAGLLAASVGVRAAPFPRRWAVAPFAVALGFTVWGFTDVAADRTLRRALEAEAGGRFAQSQRLADDAAGVAAGRVQYLQAAARLHGRVGVVTGRPDDFERAVATVDDALDVLPRDLELAMDRGDLLLSWGEATGDRALVAAAAAQYEGVLDRDPASSRAHLKLGVAHVQLGRADDAERAWRRAASLAPRSPAPLVNLGRLYVQEGRAGEARRVLAAALRLDPGDRAASALLEELGP
jgi:O-antigen ligase/Flp pilus assembly protein TadD